MVVDTHIEEKRFFLSYKSWFAPAMTLLAGLWLASFGMLFVYNEYIGDTKFGQSVYIFGVVCAFFGIFLLSALFFGANGKHGREFKGQLLWGAGVDGVFMMSPEMRPTEYVWSRIQKIEIVEKVVMPDPEENEIDIYISNNFITTNASGRSTIKSTIILHLDHINSLETKTGKMFRQDLMKGKKKIALPYHPLEPARVKHLLSKYTPQGVTIERRAELNLYREAV